jgi:hypothetical protein
MRNGLQVDVFTDKTQMTMVIVSQPDFHLDLSLGAQMNISHEGFFGVTNPGFGLVDQ